MHACIDVDIICRNACEHACICTHAGVYLPADVDSLCRNVYVPEDTDRTSTGNRSELVKAEVSRWETPRCPSTQTCAPYPKRESSPVRCLQEYASRYRHPCMHPCMQQERRRGVCEGTSVYVPRSSLRGWTSTLHRYTDTFSHLSFFLRFSPNSGSTCTVMDPMRPRRADAESSIAPSEGTDIGAISWADDDDQGEEVNVLRVYGAPVDIEISR